MALTVILEFDDHDEGHVRDLIESIDEYNASIMVFDGKMNTWRPVQPTCHGGVYTDIMAIEGKSLEERDALQARLRQKGL
jgi:hypothetical protein